MFTSTFWIRLTYSAVIVGATAVTLGLVVLLQSKSHIFSAAAQPDVQQEVTVTPFPVSVNMYTEKINEDTTVDDFFTNTLANAPESSHKWWNQVAAVFSSHTWYQNLASPVSRIIVIWPGERKEEVVKNISDVLRWDTADQAAFEALIDESAPDMVEGKYYPGQYVAHRSATPEDIFALVSTDFQNEITSRYTAAVEASVPLEDALIIASLLEREASDFHNMREVSGVIWNRLFMDMPLQLDATLQYAKASNPYESKWWPVVRPEDKFIDSPYNTYQNAGLPPAPIANPSAEAILAALNPVDTACVYYFHAERGQYFCSETYEEHVQKLRELYGQGS